MSVLHSLIFVQLLQTSNDDALVQAWKPRRGSLTLGSECPKEER